MKSVCKDLRCRINNGTQQLGHFHQARKACLKKSFSSNRCSCLMLEELSNHLELLCILPADLDINLRSTTNSLRKSEYAVSLAHNINKRKAKYHHTSVPI